MTTLRETTDFLGNGFGIDPEDCGCTDCLTGQAFPLGDPRILEAFAAGRALYNRSGERVELPGGLILSNGDSLRWRVVRYGAQHCSTCTCE